MRILFFFIIGVIVGAIGMTIIRYDTNASLKEHPYFVLNTDCKIEGAGTLKKGTLLKIDNGMDEGYTRFILYLNAKGIDIAKVDTLKPSVIIPYLLNE